MRDEAGEEIVEHRPPEPFDIAALAREQPSWRLHRVHPALGLLAAEEAGARRRRPHARPAVARPVENRRAESRAGSRVVAGCRCAPGRALRRRRRGLDARGRARRPRDARRILHAWEQYGARALPLVGIFALTRVLADTWQSALLIFVALFTVMLAVGNALERWHRHS